MHEMRKRDNAGQRHRSRRRDQAEGGNRDEIVYVSNRQRSSRGEADKGRPSSLRRAKTTDETRPAKRERPYIGGERERRHSERQVHRRDEERVHTPLRREKRTISDNVSRRRGEEPPVR